MGLNGGGLGGRGWDNHGVAGGCDDGGVSWAVRNGRATAGDGDFLGRVDGGLLRCSSGLWLGSLHWGLAHRSLDLPITDLADWSIGHVWGRDDSANNGGGNECVTHFSWD